MRGHAGAHGCKSGFVEMGLGYWKKVWIHLYQTFWLSTHCRQSHFGQESFEIITEE